MIIIKNKLIQMILTGFLFAFILGILSFLRSAITDDQSQRVKEVVIIDIKYDNVIGGLLKTVNEFELLIDIKF